MMHLLDSCASPIRAVLTFHADYRKWYFAARLDLDDAVGHTQNPNLQRLHSERGGGRNHLERSLTGDLERWRLAMNNMSQHGRMRQIANFQNRIDPVPEDSTSARLSSHFHLFTRDQG
jgi:1,3-beta-glucan synthase